MGNNNTVSVNKREGAAPLWSLLLLLAYVAHLCEEYWAGPGFSEWTRATIGAEVSPSRFFVINGVAFALFSIILIGAVRNSRLAWLAAAVAALFGLNGVVHLLASAAFATYSPGTLSGILLYLPLGGGVLYSMSQSLHSSEFTRAVWVGILFHALVSLVAFI